MAFPRPVLQMLTSSAILANNGLRRRRCGSVKGDAGQKPSRWTENAESGNPMGSHSECLGGHDAPGRKEQ